MEEIKYCSLAIFIDLFVDVLIQNLPLSDPTE